MFLHAVYVYYSDLESFVLHNACERLWSSIHSQRSSVSCFIFCSTFLFRAFLLLSIHFAFFFFYEIETVFMGEAWPWRWPHVSRHSPTYRVRKGFVPETSYVTQILRVSEFDLVTTICVCTYIIGPRFNGLIGGRGVRYCRKSVKSNVF
jgi:hypothetical protein